MDMLAQAMAVAGVLALLGATLWWLRRRGFASPVLARRGQGRVLKSVERLPLGPQHALHLVRVGETALVVGCSPASCTLVARLDPRELDMGGALRPGTEVRP